MCKVTSAWSLQKAASFGGNELLLHKHTGTPTHVCVCVFVCCVYENSQVKGQAGVFNRHPQKHATIFCLFFVVREREQPGEKRNVTYTQRGSPAVRFTMGQSAVEHFMLLFFGFMFPTSISLLLFLQLCQKKTHASIKPKGREETNQNSRQTYEK